MHPSVLVVASLLSACGGGGGGGGGGEVPACDEDPHATGCDCNRADFPEPEICYEGPGGTLGVGGCHAGLRTCEDDRWSACDGQVLPAEEICNREDDDCGGQEDNGVASECRTCGTDCRTECVGIGCERVFDPTAEGAAGVLVGDDGGLTVDGALEHHLIWIPNSVAATVSKFDTRTRQELGRYDTGPGAAVEDRPRRLGVNLHGDVVVANSGSGELLRIDASECPDVDGDGLETSSGPDDVYAWGEDECFAWSSFLAEGLEGTTFELRPGLDGVTEEFVWAGSTTTSTIYEVDAIDGSDTGRAIVDVDPRAVVVGRDNSLWTFRAGVPPVLLNIGTIDAELRGLEFPLPAGESSAGAGLAVDADGRIWMGGTVARYSEVSDEWDLPDPSIEGGGIACDSQGDAFVGELGAVGGPWRVAGGTLQGRQLAAGVGGGHAWAVDFDGFVWAIGGGQAWIYDPKTLALDGALDDLPGVDTTSDLTGFQFRAIAGPMGSLPVVFEAPPDCENVDWDVLRWEADVPEMASIEFAIRTADDLAGLAAAWPVVRAGVPPVVAPIDLRSAMAMQGRLLSVGITLRGPGDPPVLRTLTVSFGCLL